jgi:predicted Rossmann fold flavoprotein
VGEPDRDIAVVGAGAAGLMAAIFAAREGRRVVALDGATKIGAKILISGGGRCNVTHEVVTPDDFSATNRNLLAKVLRSFDVEETVAFFRAIGVELRSEETRKLFPVTDRAATVLDALVREAARVGAEVRTGFRVERVESAGERGFVVHSSTESIGARRVILATGGRSIPKTGSDGHGYSIAESFGHTILPTFPALVPLLVEGDHWLKSLKGASAEVDLTLTGANGRVVRRVRGSMLFAHFGISGPAALDMSRHWIASRAAGEPVELAVSFLPGESHDAVESWILDEGAARPRASVSRLLRARLTERLVDAVLASEAQVEPSTALGRLTKAQRRAVIRALLATPLPVTGDRGFAFAEVTAGGVPLTEVDVRTMASRCQAGLHLCGEILDVDGRIGGFNFQWAWASGRLAGIGAGRG